MDRPLAFWLKAALVGLVVALAAAAVGAVWLSLMTGFDQLAKRGLALFAPHRVAQGATLTLVYLGFFALFLIPFAMTLVPASYALAARAARDPGVGRVIFVFLAMLGGTFGPWLVEQGLIALRDWRGLSSGVRPLQLSELFIPFGLLAAPVGAWFVWPVLRRMDQRMRRPAPPSPSPLPAEAS
jgi:hypothetical protein